MPTITENIVEFLRIRVQQKKSIVEAFSSVAGESATVKALYDSCFDISEKSVSLAGVLSSLKKIYPDGKFTESPLQNPEFKNSFTSFLRMAMTEVYPLFFDEEDKLYPQLKELIADDKAKEVFLTYFSAYVLKIIDGQSEKLFALQLKNQFSQFTFNETEKINLIFNEQSSSQKIRRGNQETKNEENDDVIKIAEAASLAIKKQVELYESMEKWGAAEDALINTVINVAERIRATIAGYTEEIKKDEKFDINRILKTKFIILSECITFAMFELAAATNTLVKIEDDKKNVQYQLPASDAKQLNAIPEPLQELYKTLNEQREFVKNQIVKLENLEEVKKNTNAQGFTDSDGFPKQADFNTVINTLESAYNESKQAILKDKKLSLFERFLQFIFRIKIKTANESVLDATQAPFRGLKLS